MQNVCFFGDPWLANSHHMLTMYAKSGNIRLFHYWLLHPFCIVTRGVHIPQEVDKLACTSTIDPVSHSISIDVSYNK